MFQSGDAKTVGVDFFPQYETSAFLKDLDVVILAVQLIDLEEVLASLPPEKLAGKLLVDVSPVNSFPRDLMLRLFSDQSDIDILVTNPMMGPKPKAAATRDDSNMWDGRPMAYDRVRISDMQRCERYLRIFEDARCQVLEMDSKQHDESIAQAEFVTHTIGRLLNNGLLPATPLMSKEYEDLCDVAEMTAGDTLDMFFGMYKHNKKADEYLAMMRESLADIEKKLAARSAYLEAKAEIMQSDRQKLLSETRMLLQELARTETNQNSAFKTPSMSASQGAKTQEVPPNPDYPTSPLMQRPDIPTNNGAER